MRLLLVPDGLQWSKNSSAKCAVVHVRFNQTKAQGAGAHPTGYSCTSERRPQLCRTCQRLPPPCTVMKMIPSTPSPLVHTPFRLQPVRGWLASSMYLVATICVEDHWRFQCTWLLPHVWRILRSQTYSIIIEYHQASLVIPNIIRHQAMFASSASSFVKMMKPTSMTVLLLSFC